MKPLKILGAACVLISLFTLSTVVKADEKGWSFKRGKDQFTDEIWCVAILVADDPQSTEKILTGIGVGYTEDKGLHVLISTNFFVSASSDGMAQVRYRFDTDKPVKERWLVVDKSVHILPSYKTFIAALQSKKELLFEITNDTGRSYRNRFRGLEKNTHNLKQVVDGCKLKGVKADGEGWSLDRREDEFTGKKSYNAHFNSSADDSSGTKEGLEAIMVQCYQGISRKYGGYRVHIFTNSLTSSAGTAQVRFRFDDDKPIEGRWQAGNSSFGLGIVFIGPEDKGFTEFITALQSKKELLFEITDDTGKSYRNRFRGLDKNARNLQQVVDACKKPTGVTADDGGWSLDRRTDKVTGKVRYIARFYSLADEPSGKTEITVQCLEGMSDRIDEYRVGIFTNFFISTSSGRTIRIQYRFDGEEPIEERWLAVSWQTDDGSDYSSVFIDPEFIDPEDAGFEEFIAALQNKKELLFEITDDTNKSYRTRFRGLDKNADNLKQVIDACQP